MLAEIGVRFRMANQDRPTVQPTKSIEQSEKTSNFTFANVIESISKYQPCFWNSSRLFDEARFSLKFIRQIIDSFFEEKTLWKASILCQMSRSFPIDTSHGPPWEGHTAARLTHKTHKHKQASCVTRWIGIWWGVIEQHRKMAQDRSLLCRRAKWHLRAKCLEQISLQSIIVRSVNKPRRLFVMCIVSHCLLFAYFIKHTHTQPTHALRHWRRSSNMQNIQLFSREFMFLSFNGYRLRALKHCNTCLTFLSSVAQLSFFRRCLFSIGLELVGFANHSPRNWFDLMIWSEYSLLRLWFVFKPHSNRVGCCGWNFEQPRRALFISNQHLTWIIQIQAVSNNQFLDRILIRNSFEFFSNLSDFVRISGNLSDFVQISVNWSDSARIY